MGWSWAGAGRTPAVAHSRRPRPGSTSGTAASQATCCCADSRAMPASAWRDDAATASEPGLHRRFGR
ncbi:hypothetical protein DB759_22410, partial [Xanthomonas perforans]